MPHSVSPDSSPPVPGEETLVQMAELDVAAGESEQVKPETQSDDDDVDMTMAEVGGAPAVEEPKKEVKLDDLFADVDSDEEFPSSRPTQTQPTSSPGPQSSPGYGRSLGRSRSDCD